MPNPTTITRGPNNPIVAEGGKTTRIAIAAPTAGEVKRVYLKQVAITETDGEVTGVVDATDGFTYRWFAAAAGAPPGVDQEVRGDVEDRYAVSPAVTVPPGESQVLKDGAPDDFGQTFEYVNLDGNISNRQGRLYLKIAPGGAGPKTFLLFMTVKPF